MEISYKDIKKDLVLQKEEAGMAFDGKVYLDVPSFYAVLDALCKASHESIRIDVLKGEKSGCDAAEQCDQGSAYSRKLSDAIKTVLEWYTSPAYKMRIDSMRRYGHDV